MPKFSKFFKINAPQAALDFVDVNTDEDIPVYVDPYAIEIRDDVWAERASFLIRTFFTEVLSALRSGDDYRAANLMSHLHEPEETYLGVSKGKPKGRGVGPHQASQLIAAIKGSKAYQTGMIEDLSEMALFVANIDRDKISDLTTNIIRSQLVQYTCEQCALYGIPTRKYSGPPFWDPQNFNWTSRDAELPFVEDSPVMLVPKYIVRKRLSLDSDEFYKKQITDFLVAEHLSANSSLVQVLKNRRRKVYKGDVRKKHPKSKSMIADIVADHPELLAVYKEMAKKISMMINFSDEDLSVAQVCVELASQLKNVPVGANHADQYHTISMAILSTCLYPKLIQPHKEWEINGGRKRIDLVFTNAADQGFFAQRRDANNTQAAMIIVECKNYGKDINNPEVDQLLGRFDLNRGKFGIITCRSIEDTDRITDRLRDLAKSGVGFILCLTDKDLLQILELKQFGDDNAIENFFHQKFREIIS